MERLYPQSVGEVLRLLFQENCMQERLDERKAVTLWPTVIGPEIASSCRAPQVKQGVMTVGVPNAALRQELNMQRTPLRNALNRATGSEPIKEIRFVL